MTSLRVAGPLPATHQQSRLWFLDQMDRANGAYNITTGLRLTGTLDRPALVQALTAIVSRHEILRTRFVDIDGAPFQVVDPTPRCDLDRAGRESAGCRRAARGRGGCVAVCVRTRIRSG